MKSKNMNRLMKISLLSLFILTSALVMSASFVTQTAESLEELENDNQFDDIIEWDQPLTSATINPADYDFYGTGVEVDATFTYDSTINTNNPFVTGSTSRTINDGSGSSFDYTDVKNSDGTTDQITADYQSSTTWDDDDSANSYSVSTCSDHGVVGVGSVNLAVSTADNNGYVFQKVHDAKDYWLEISGFAPFHGSSTVNNRKPIYVYDVQLYWDIYADTSAGTTHLNMIGVYASIGATDGTADNCVDPGDPGHFSGWADVGSSNLLTLINSGSSIDSITFDYSDSGNSALDNDYLNVDFLRLRYYYRYEYRVDVVYETQLVPSGSYRNDLTSVTMSADVDDAFGGSAAVYIYDPASSTWDSQQTYDDPWTGFTFTKTITSSFDHYIDSSGNIQIRFIGDYPYDSGSSHSYTEMKFNIDEIEFSWEMERTVPLTYNYFYNKGDPHPHYGLVYNAQGVQTILPDDVVIPKPQYYELETIYDPDDLDETSNPDRINGEYGDTDITLQNFVTQWTKTGEWQFIYNATNLLNSSDFVKSLDSGYNDFKFENETLTAIPGDKINIFTNISDIYASMSISELKSTITDVSGNPRGSFVTSYSTADGFNSTFEVQENAFGLQNLTLLTNITDGNGDIEYVGYYHDYNNITVYEETSFEHVAGNAGAVFWDATEQKYNYSFSLFGMNDLFDAAIVMVNESSDNEMVQRKLEIDNAGSEDINLTAVYYNTTLLNLDQGLSIIFEFEYVGGGSFADVDLHEISLIPRILDGNDRSLSPYKRTDLGTETVNSGNSRNVTVYLDEQSLQNYGNMGLIDTVYDIYIEFEELSSGNISSSLLQQIPIIPWSGDIIETKFVELAYVNDSSSPDVSVLFGNYASTGHFVLSTLIAHNTLQSFTDMHGNFGNIPTAFTCEALHNSSHEGVNYYNDTFTLRVNASMLPENDVLDILSYKINNTDTGEVCLDWTHVDYSYYGTDGASKIWEYDIMLDEFADANYTVTLQVIDTCGVKSIRSIDLCLDTYAPEINPSGYPQYDWSNNSVFDAADSIEINVSDPTIDISRMKYSLNGGEWQNFAELSPTIDISNLNAWVTLDVSAFDLAGNQATITYRLGANYDAEPDFSSVSIPSLYGSKMTELLNPEISVNVVDENLDDLYAELYRSGSLIRTINPEQILSGQDVKLNLGILDNNTAYKLNITAIDEFGSIEVSSYSFTALTNQLDVEVGSRTYRFFIEDQRHIEVLLTAQTAGTMSYQSIIPTGLDDCVDMFNIETTGNIEGPITLRVYYNPDRLSNLGLLTDLLKIQRYNESTEEWDILSTTINTDEHYAEATVDHFSVYALTSVIEGSAPPNYLLFGIILAAVGVAVAGGIGFLFNRSEIKQQNAEFRKFKKKFKTPRTDEDVKNLLDETAPSNEDVENEEDIELITEEDYHSLDVQKLDIEDLITDKKPLKTLKRKFEIETKPFKKKFKQNEEMYKNGYINEQAYDQNVSIISSELNKIITEKYEPVIKKIKKRQSLRDENSFYNLELVVLLDHEQTHYIKQFGGATTDDEEVKAYLQILKTLVED